MTLEVVNGAEWAAGLQNAFADLEIDSEQELAKLAGEISANMRADAPVMDSAERQRRLASPGGRVRKSPGRNTIRFRRGRDRRGFYIDVGPGRGAFYFAFREYGTSQQSARPFLRPAIERAIAAWGKK